MEPDTLAISNGLVHSKEQPQVVGTAFHSGSQLTAMGVPFEEVLRMANLSGIHAVGKTFPSFEDPKARSILCTPTVRTLPKWSGSRILRDCG